VVLARGPTEQPTTGETERTLRPLTLSTSWSALPQHATMNARLFPGVRPTRSSSCLRASFSCTSRLTFAAPLVASCNFSRQYAELIDVPIANKHLDSGCHCLIAGVSLGMASSLPRPQMLEFEHGVWCISIVSHGPSPSQCRLLISAPNMAVSGRPLGAIWAAYLFAPNKKPRPERMVGCPPLSRPTGRAACTETDPLNVFA
jgi:hypothetical protein